MRGGEEILHPRRRPFHRAAEQLRRIGDDGVLRIGTGLHPEPAADIADQDAHLLGRQVQHLGADLVARAGRRLGAHRHRDAVGPGIVGGDHHPRLHRDRRQALVDDVERDDMRRGGEGGIGHGAVAVLRLRHDIAGGSRPHLRRAWRGGGGGRGHRGHFLVVDDHRLGAVTGRAHGLADHGDHGFAGEIRLAHRQHRPWRRGERRAVRSLEGQRDAEPPEAGGFEVGAGQHRQHAGDGLGLRRVDRHDARMRMRRAQEDHMGLAGQRDVVGEGTGAAQQRPVLDPPHCLAAAETAEAAIHAVCHDPALAHWPAAYAARAGCGKQGASSRRHPRPCCGFGKEPAHDRHHAAGR